MNNFLEELQKEYDKLHCPICGCTPRVVPTTGHQYETHSCGHPQLESMIEELENHFPLQEEKKLIHPWKK
jgi:hypothetical protein